MPVHFLLDTDILIYYRGKHSDRVESHIMALQPGEAAVSVVSFGELSFGAYNSPHMKEAFDQLRVLAQVFPVLALPEGAGDYYGSFRAALHRRGQPVGNNDLWVAAHARAADLTLVSNNEREFRRIPGLKLENWAK